MSSMARHARFSRIACAVVVLVAAGCGQGSSPTATPNPTPMPPATSASEFATAFCSSLQGMARAIGNPDTAADSILSAALDDAIRSGDAAAVEAAAARMQAELESGRRFAAVAAAWEPGAKLAGVVDQLIVAFEAMVEAKRAAADQGLAAADQKAQAALMDAGAGTAWQALLSGESKVPSEAANRLVDCRWWEAGAPSPAPGGASPQPVD
jgi:propanediol dehydratase small subunit